MPSLNRSSVWKFPLRLQSGRQDVLMPEGARVLCAHWQDSDLCVWALVDLGSKSYTSRGFIVAGTGHQIATDEAGPYVGTVHVHTLVFHVFEGVADALPD